MKVKNRVLTAALALAFAAALIIAPHAAKAAISSLSLSTTVHSFTLDSSGTPLTGTTNLVLTALIAGADVDGVNWSVSGTSVTLEDTADPLHSVIVKPSGMAGVSVVRATSIALDGTSPKVASCTVYVYQQVDIDIAPPSPLTDPIAMTTGDASKLITATITPAGRLDPSKYKIVWTSSDDRIATIAPSSLPSLTASVTPGTKNGTAIITAKVFSDDNIYIGGATDTLAVNVTNPNPYLTLTSSQTSFADYGLPQTVSLNLYNGGGTYAGNEAITWTLSNNDVIQLTSSSAALSSGTGSATFTTKKNGTVKLTATIKDASGNALSDSVTITVAKPLPTLSLEGDSNMNASNRNGHLTAALTQNPGNAVASNAALRWSVDSSKLATVTGDANMTNYSANATVHSLYNGTIRVTVALRNDSSVSAYHTMYITGLSYLPQTGQDSTVLYVIGGACLVLFATAGILYARRKKNAQRA